MDPGSLHGQARSITPPRAAAGSPMRAAQSAEIIIPTIMLTLIVAAGFIWPLVKPLPDPVGGSALESNRPLLSAGHVLGTDLNGNDVLSRLLHGRRTSIEIALAVNAMGLLLGGLLGAASGYRGGIVDLLIMRMLDVLIAFPSLVLALAVAQSLGPSRLNTIWALAFFSVPAFARLARAATLRLREQPFMLAAQLSGVGMPRILMCHIAPNIIMQLASFALLGMGTVIVIEGALSFLGLGIPAPAPSWGNMIAHGQQALSARPALVLLPSVCLLLTVLAFNLLGEAVRARCNRP